MYLFFHLLHCCVGGGVGRDMATCSTGVKLRPAPFGVVVENVGGTIPDALKYECDVRYNFVAIIMTTD